MKTKKTSRTWKLTGILVAVSAVLDVVLARWMHPEFWWQKLPAYDLIYGFIGCTALILFSKWLGHRFLMRSEDYYEREP